MARRLLAVALRILAEDSQDVAFCSHNLPWDQCKDQLPVEQEALHGFLKDLEESPKPASAFKGKGIVMSGGKGHVLQALANLDVLRFEFKSYLPVEFWHAFELEDGHCEALAASGAVCRQLQVPGVYKAYATIVPAVMSSSFQHVMWMDTDITPLVLPELLFESEAYQQTGALFWPDHWSHNCYPFGESSWRNHVALRLLELKYNDSENSYLQEHETGLFLIDKEIHWRSICLASYLASRHFFTKVLVGCKDAFRFAFLKRNVTNWLSSVRPGLVGSFTRPGYFLPAAMVQFWPPTEPLGDGRYQLSHGRPIPLFIHHKKRPGFLWTDIVTFRQPMGECTRFMTERLLDLSWGDTDLWGLANSEPQVARTVFGAEQVWEASFDAHFKRLKNHPGLSRHSKNVLKSSHDPSQRPELDTITQSCPCDFGNNFWLHLLTFLVPAKRKAEDWLFSGHNHCDFIFQPDLDRNSCLVGFATLAFLCYDGLGTSDKQRVKEVVEDLLTRLEKCLPTSFWPIKMQHLKQLDEPKLGGPSLVMDPEVVSQLATPLQRCLPLKFPPCWGADNAFTNDVIRMSHSCFFCCGTAVNFSGCFDEAYTEELCCNTLPAAQL